MPYSNVVDCMMYSMIATRPDVAYRVGLVSRFMSCPSKDYWHAIKLLLRYLKGSSKLGLSYSKTEMENVEIRGYCDADFAADLDKRRSLTGYYFTLGGNLIS